MIMKIPHKVYQILSDTAKAMFRVKFITSNAYSLKHERLKINGLIFHLKEVRKRIFIREHQQRQVSPRKD